MSKFIGRYLRITQYTYNLGYEYETSNFKSKKRTLEAGPTIDTKEYFQRRCLIKVTHLCENKMVQSSHCCKNQPYYNNFMFSTIANIIFEKTL